MINKMIEATVSRERLEAAVNRTNNPQQQMSNSKISMKALDDPETQMAKFETANGEHTIMKPINLDRILHEDALNGKSIKDSVALGVLRKAGLPIDLILARQGIDGSRKIAPDLSCHDQGLDDSKPPVARSTKESKYRCIPCNSVFLCKAPYESHLQTPEHQQSVKAAGHQYLKARESNPDRKVLRTLEEYCMPFLAAEQ